uniref:Uncharacterized protein n=1 Tax=Micrurus surinamensis TaxID=129470 RepID=A0A2D4Q3T8_MICSU
MKCLNISVFMWCATSAVFYTVKSSSIYIVKINILLEFPFFFNYARFQMTSDVLFKSSTVMSSGPKLPILTAKSLRRCLLRRLKWRIQLTWLQIHETISYFQG